MKRVLFSAISLYEGGPLKIAYNVLDEIILHKLYQRYEIIFLVYKMELFEDYQHYSDSIKFIEFRDARDGILKKYLYEWFNFKGLSRELNTDLWITLTSKTPNVSAKKQLIYFSNPTPFSKVRAVDYTYGLGYVLFSLFYRYIVRVNIKRNDYIVVQQRWLREAIAEKYKFSRDRIIVSYANEVVTNPSCVSGAREEGVKSFFFPAIARQFKNFEVICQAAEILVSRGVKGFSVKLTIDGSENRYSRIVFEKYRHVEQVSFCGLINFSEMPQEYQQSDCLIFPSYLETWGLPISEFKVYNRPMLIADLPYAHETASGATMVEFFNPSSAEALAEAMQRLIEGDYSGLKPVAKVEIEEPKAEGWSDLLSKILE